jgi:hypothetical protein
MLFCRTTEKMVSREIRKGTVVFTGIYRLAEEPRIAHSSLGATNDFGKSTTVAHRSLHLQQGNTTNNS